MSDRERILSRVQALYAKAASTDFGPEAEAYTAKAEELMLRYSIEQAEIANSSGEGHRFEIREFALSGDYEIRNVAWSILSACANHWDLKMVPSFEVDGYRFAGTVGDLDFAELMYTNLLGHMAKTLDPKPDPSATEAENLYSLKMAGFKWVDVHRMMYPDLPWERKHGVRYTRVVKIFAEERGLERNMVGGADGLRNYRTQFAHSYVQRLRERLAELKDHSKEIREENSLVLFGKDEALKEYVWDLYPNMRPHPADCDCDTCHRCYDSSCQRPRCVLARQPLPRIPRGRARTYSYNPTAVNAGKRAANNADLGQTRIGQRKAIQ